MNPPQRIDLRRVTPQPWKNGAGLTREIAFGGASSSHFDWRISLAEVSRDAPFSAFPGIERCIVLLRGAGMRLRSHDGALDHVLTEPLEPFRFSGDVADATLVDGASSDFNVMTRRRAFLSEVTVQHSAGEWRSGDATLLLCCAGEWRIADQAVPLAPMQALLWREPVAGIEAAPVGEASALLLVRLCHDRKP